MADRDAPPSTLTFCGSTPSPSSRPARPPRTLVDLDDVELIDRMPSRQCFLSVRRLRLQRGVRASDTRGARSRPATSAKLLRLGLVHHTTARPVGRSATRTAVMVPPAECGLQPANDSAVIGADALVLGELDRSLCAADLTAPPRRRRCRLSMPLRLLVDCAANSSCSARLN